jgi:UDP-glucuronate 4-epimerase
MQKGDVYKTYSDLTLLESIIGFRPKTSLRDGISEFVKWYKLYYK